ncbi:MAG TPA: GNAT family N-acetyltransferase [Candidatus Eremiobacteraceae bacterium]|nr:GNAT family N-acetyltransferase [Candidatus Eremiobacteraceae bacterium]
MPIHIRQASDQDIPSLLSLMRHMQHDDPWDEPFQETAVQKNLSELLRNPAYGLAYLACDHQIPIGYLLICFDFSLEYRGKGAWIDELFVEPPHRGLGIGAQLLDLAERAACECGASVLHLEVTHGNPAIELYRRRGFVDHQRYLMTKSLLS